MYKHIWQYKFWTSDKVTALALRYKIKWILHSVMTKETTAPAVRLVTSEASL